MAVARSKLPDPLTRRHLVERELPEAQAREIADAYLAQGRRNEAVDFLRKAAALDQLTNLRAEAIAEGDAFLLRQIADAMAQPIARDEWQALARAAEAPGRERYAAEARRHFERGEE
jgi:regulator of protease activity HflC (stomatin/prohibitin superfamily)